MSNLKTYGDLKRSLDYIRTAKKDEKIGDAVISAVIGNIPGIGQAKTVYDLLKASFKKPDTKKTDSWLDKLDVDDEVEAIVDDTVEDGFLRDLAKRFESEPDDKPLEPDFNMNQKMVDYLKDNYNQRTVTGIKEQKSVFDKFFTKFAYKFDKGYPDMNNDQDVLLLESLISETTGFILEIGKIKKHNNAKEKIINSPLGKKAGLTPMSTSATYRIGNPNKKSQEEFIEIIKSIYPETEIEVLTKGVGDNKSGQYSLYKFKTDEGDVSFYLAGGGNEGEKYEQNFIKNAQIGAGQPNSDLPKNLQTLYKELGIDNTKLTKDNITFDGATNTKRDLNFDGPENIGEIVSDMTIDYPGGPYFISLKNTKGSGVLSGKNVPFIVGKPNNREPEVVVYDASKRNDIPNISKLYDMFGIDPERVAQGLTDYINKEGEEDSWSNVDVDEKQFQNILASSFGYGYYYVKEIKGDDVKVVPILTAEQARGAAGEITSSVIKYAGPKTKITAVKVKTYSKLFGPSEYIVASRNTQKGIVPLALRITKQK
jgi:hypothetical protein